MTIELINGKVAITEVNAKIERIKELSKAGLNTPKIFFVPIEPGYKDLSHAMTWASEIFNSNNNRKFNIRTYNRKGIKETLSTTHVCDIEYLYLYDIILDLSEKFNCMVDAETPDNGRLSGNILISLDEYFNIEFITIDYCTKEIRAMVRDADKTYYINNPDCLNVSGLLQKTKKQLLNIDYRLNDVLEKAIVFKKNVILEWTYFCNPTGMLNENIVFWEYRKY